MKSIRSKILMCMSLTVAFTMLILGGTSIYLNYSSSNQLLEQTMKETAKIAAGRVSKELESYMNVAVDAGCIARLADPEQSIENKREIINQRAESHGFQRGNIIGEDGISIFDGNDYSDRYYYQQAMKGKTYISEPLISKITGKFSIMISAPLWEKGIPDTKVVGAVYFVPTETFLNDIVSSIHISENSTAYVINSSGVTIADKTMDTITTQNIEEEAKTDSSLKMLAQIHEKMRNGESGFGEYKINGVQKFSSYAPIAGTDGWSIGVVAPGSDFMSSTYFAIIITIVLLFVSLAVVFFIALRLANGIGNPVKLCADRLKKLALGNLTAEVPKVNSRDEIGVLAEATSSIVYTMHGIITDMDWGLGEMASGNFEIDSKSKELYIGDFESLANSMYKILDHLSTTLRQINQSAEQVASGSEQVSAGAQALSQGATEQAASVEELAATINDISLHVRQNAENVNEANKKAEYVGDEISQSNRRMQDLLKAISDISNSSNEIQKIVKTIEDIAFQTNILALNAAVEAARAGTAGKGFAVVADEVRSLSIRSADASKNTTQLIENTLKSISEGTIIAGDTAESLESVVSGVKEVIDKMNQISEASNNQSQSILQVTQGIDQISSVVQTNSATAEESASASEELSGQSQLLKDLVGRFRLKDLSD